ncbi:MAG: DHH family phosphoesterase [Spirochaetota bacterium]
MSDSPLASPGVPAEVLAFLREYDTYYIVGHVEPDGDCLASSLALGSYLERHLNKRTRLYNAGPFERREIVSLENRFQPRLDADDRAGDSRPAAIILDCSGPSRVGSLESDIEGLPVAVIDHHATNTAYGDARFVVPTAPATCYLVQLVMEALGGGITTEEAELLLFGIATDTGYFRHAEADAADLFAGVSRLMAAGASPKRTHGRMFGGHTLASRQLLATLLARAEPIAGGAGVITYETLEDTERFGRTSRDSDTLYQLLFGIDGLRTAALLREERDITVSGSLRSIDAIDVSAIAQRFGGGGHKRAAGFTAPLALDDALQRVRSELERALRSDET